MDLIRDYDFHPPADLRLFPMPRAGVLRLDDEMFVAEVRYDDIVLRHYAFRDHWFKINCTRDLSGRFVETTSSDDTLPFTFNCDIATPMVREDDAVYGVDLWLDVLVRSDGVTHEVHDEDDFARALAEGWLSEREATGARAGVEELLDIIRQHRLVELLADAHPFGPTLPPPARPTEHLPPDGFPFVLPYQRPSW